MARVTHVKHARQRYATKPVLDKDGNPVTRTRNLSRPTKRGKTESIQRVTERDLTKPLPNYRCDKCGTEILPGQPYKWIKPKSGPYGGHMKTRCGACPSWNIWEYSNSLSAQIARIEYDATTSAATAESEDDVRSALESAAEEIREIAEQKREGAANIESGFGHSTYQSEELESMADELDSWADEVEQTDVQALSEFECEDCGGSGEIVDEDEPEGETDCENCEAGNDLQAAQDAWSDLVTEVLSNCPV